MSVLELARRPPQWLRAVLAGLLLAFALNSIAHAAHAHEQDKASTIVHAAACGYCATFGATSPAPSYAHSLPVPEYVRSDIAAPETLPRAFFAISNARARAPPVS